MTIKAIETIYKGYKFRSRLEARWAVFFDNVGLKWEYEPEGFMLADGTKYLPDFLIKNHPTWMNEEFRLWLEVKPGFPTDEELRKIVLLKAGLLERDDQQNHASTNVGILCGSPGLSKIDLDANKKWHIADGYVILVPNALTITGKAKKGVYPARFASPEEILKDKAELRIEMQVFAMVGGGTVFDMWPLYLAGTKGEVMGLPDGLQKIANLSESMTCISPIYPEGANLRLYNGPGVSYGTMNLRMAYTTARQARFEHGATPA